MKIIGLTGAAGAGKDTVCGFALEWCEEKGINAERLAFADPLKVSAARALGYDLPCSPEDEVEMCNWLKTNGDIVILDNGRQVHRISGRQFLQFYGTEAHRDVFGSEFWVTQTEIKLEELAYHGEVDVVFLTDPRFPNEATMIHKHDGEIWEVVRPNQSTVEAHASEAGLPEGAIEFQIHNNSNLESLRSLVRSVCEHNLEEVA